MKKKAIFQDFIIEIKYSLSRFFSILLIVALGVAFFSGIRSTKPDMQLSADQFYDSNYLMDIRVVSTLGLTEEDVTALEQVDGVAHAEPAYSFDALCNTETSTLVVKLLSNTNTLNLINIIEGRLPKDSTECLVDPQLIEYSGYQIGDTITLQLEKTDNILDKLTNQRFTITGIGTSPYYLSRERGNSLIGNGNVNSFIVITPETFRMDAYTDIYLAVENARELTSYTTEYENTIEAVVENIEAIADSRREARYQEIIEEPTKEIQKAKTELQQEEAKANSVLEALLNQKETLAISEKEYEEAVVTAKREIADAKEQIADGEKELAEIEYPKWYVLDRNSIQTYVEYGQDAERIGNIGKVFPAIFFLVAALVSLTTMTRMVEEERIQIGTLKALGYNKSTIASKYIMYGLLATLFGSLLGIAIGGKVLPIVIITAYKLLYTNLPSVIAPYNIYFGILSTIIAVMTTTLATFFACYKELMLPPSQLMRPVAPKHGKRVILEQLPWLWNRLNFTSKSTIRNLLRYKKRFFMTVFGIGGCMSLLLVGFGLMDSIGAMSSIQYVDIWHQDASLTIKTESTDNERNNLKQFLSDNNNEIQSSFFFSEKAMDVGFGKTVKNANLLVPMENQQLNEYIDLRNRVTGQEYDLEDGSVIINEKLASLLKVEVGDTIYLSDDEAKRFEVKITGIVENYMMHYVFMTSSIYELLFETAPDYNKMFLKTSKLSEAKEDALASELLELPAVASITFTSDLQDQLDDMLNSLNIVVIVLIVAAGLLAFVVLYNLNNININERQRELATLKVLGFLDLEVATYVFRENVLLTIIGSIVGVFLGIIMHRFVILTVEIDMIMFGRNINLSSFIYSILLTFGFSAVVNFVMFYKLRRIDMVESLKSIE